VPLSAIFDDTRRKRMKGSTLSQKQVAYALRQIQTGTPVGDGCRQLGISEATFMSGGIENGSARDDPSSTATRFFRFQPERATGGASAIRRDGMARCP
jgi:putative transposase